MSGWIQATMQQNTIVLPPKSLYRMDSCEILLKNTTDQKASQSIRLQNSDNYLTIKWQLMKNQNVEVWC